MSIYEPQITTAEQVREEFAAVSVEFTDAASEAFTDEFLENHRRTLSDPVLAQTYSQYLPFVHRFLVAELDTEAPSKRGIGRLADGDPPPRLGAKYRKQLRDGDAQREIGLASERLLLSGFAAQAIFYEEELGAGDEDEAWALWLRHLVPYYNDTSELSDRARDEEESNLGVIGAMMITLGDHGGGELIEAFEKHKIIKGLRKNTWHNARALSYLLLLLGAGRACTMF